MSIYIHAHKAGGVRGSVSRICDGFSEWITNFVITYSGLDMVNARNPKCLPAAYGMSIEVPRQSNIK